MTNGTALDLEKTENILIILREAFPEKTVEMKNDKIFLIGETPVRCFTSRRGSPYYWGEHERKTSVWDIRIRAEKAVNWERADARYPSSTFVKRMEEALEKIERYIAAAPAREKAAAELHEYVTKAEARCEELLDIANANGLPYHYRPQVSYSEELSVITFRVDFDTAKELMKVYRALSEGKTQS